MVLQTIPFDPEHPFEWSVEAHNAVNKRLGKPLFTPEQAFKKLNGREFDFKIVLLALLLLIIIILYIKK
jgi:hypothetical protein